MKTAKKFVLQINRRIQMRQEKLTQKKAREEKRVELFVVAHIIIINYNKCKWMKYLY